MAEDYQNYESDKLTRKQKIMTLGLSFFGIIIVILWGLQLRNSLSNPLMPASVLQDSSTKDDSCADGSCVTDGMALYMQDTDSDGLSDGEELSIYLTSPYLEDTDSDGYSDFEEVKNNKDPNCPAGEDCYALSEPSVYNEEAAGGEEVVDYSSEQIILNQTSGEEAEISPEEEEVLQEFLSGQSEADILRALLLDAGVEAEMVNQFSDEELLAVYRETLQ